MGDMADYINNDMEDVYFEKQTRQEEKAKVIKYTISEQALRECMARAYCYKENEKKDLDATLIEAMLQEIKDACCDGG